MILQAENNIPGFKTYTWQLKDFFWMRDPAAEMDTKFTTSIMDSLSVGMKWPVLMAEHDVWEEWFWRTGASHHLYPKPIKTAFKYRLVLGNNRCHFADSYGYSGIEGILSNDLDKDYRYYLETTKMEYGKDF